MKVRELKPATDERFAKADRRFADSEARIDGQAGNTSQRQPRSTRRCVQDIGQ